MVSALPLADSIFPELAFGELHPVAERLQTRMSLARLTVPRAISMTLLVFGCVLAPAASALAHNGTGGASSDYRIEIVGWQGDHSGVELRVVELGNRLELRRTTATTVMILGYSGEPYLRLDANGVAENLNSPAHYLNRDRFASTDPPASASPDATPSWTPVSAGSTVRWHDHRAHWMSTTPRADVVADPDVERVIFASNPVDLVVDGRTVAALIRVTWLPAPRRLLWLGTAALLGLAVAAACVLVPTMKRLLPSAALLGAIAAFGGQGASSTRHVLAALVIALAIGAVVLRRPLLAAVPAVGAGILAATRLEAFEHELVAGWPAAATQRIALVLAIGLCLGVVAAAVVGALEPSRAEERAG